MEGKMRIKAKIADKRLEVVSDYPIFGNQPFFAIKTKSGQFYNDNLIVHQPFLKWSYVFDRHSLLLPAIGKIGIGANDAWGNTEVKVIDVS